MVAIYEALELNLKSNLRKLIAKHYYGRAQFDPDKHRPVPVKTKEQATANAVCEKPLILMHPTFRL